MTSFTKKELESAKDKLKALQDEQLQVRDFASQHDMLLLHTQAQERVQAFWVAITILMDALKAMEPQQPAPRKEPVL